MTESEALKEWWQRRDLGFRQQAVANAVGTFVGGLALAVLFGLAAGSARYISMPWLLIAIPVSAIVWVFAIAAAPERGVTASVMLCLLIVSGLTFTVSILAVVGRVALWGS